MRKMISLILLFQTFAPSLSAVLVVNHSDDVISYELTRSFKNCYNASLPKSLKLEQLDERRLLSFQRWTNDECKTYTYRFCKLTPQTIIIFANNEKIIVQSDAQVTIEMRTHNEGYNPYRDYIPWITLEEGEKFILLPL